VSTFFGIHDGHNASVAVVRDGRVEFALQEERLTREKNQGDAPALALAEARQFAGAETTAQVGLNGRYMNYHQWRRETIVRDYERSSNFAGRLKQPLKDTFLDRAYQRRKAAARSAEITGLGFTTEQLTPVEHHLAHASAAYYTSPFEGAKTLVLTCDGSGDRLAATVSIGAAGTLTRIAEVSEHDSIGRFYALVTRRLGMTPLEHEYKVMGLAPYAKDAEAEMAAGVFRGCFEFRKDGLSWRRKRGVPSMYAAYHWLGELTRGMRFDTLAGGAQRFIEQMLAQWVANAVRSTGIPRVACSGGVFMNVKANLAVLELPEVEELYVFPSCGDESNSVGAACHLAAAANESSKPIAEIYFGDPISDEEAEAAIRVANGRVRAHWVADIESRTAGALAAGKVVARAKGAAEFGARALGNRSILARADAPGAVRSINTMIKNRDFWMPFAPSVLAERAGDYYDKPKAVASPYMMLAFRTREEKRPALCAAMHPYDFTTRPHEVTAAHNSDYHGLLKEYEARTGEGAILNTSFNVHGEPMVYSAGDAVDTFLRSGLEHMALGNFWVRKTP
jgi:carbamoyltransferase